MLFKMNEAAVDGKKEPYKISLIIDNVNNTNPEMAEKLKNDIGNISDGYHTFNELYHHRALLFATICNEHPELAWKSKQHDDINTPMYEGMFICGINTPLGQATYHYNIDPYWDMFHVRELEKAPIYDGHTPDEAIKRIYSLGDK